GGGFFQKLPFLPQMLSRPGWLASFLLDGGMPPLLNVVIPGKGPMPLIDVAAALAECAVTWSDLKWIRDLWHGPIVIKGILTGDDARRAVDEGAAAISVSNHCGRAYAYGLAAAGEAGVHRAIEILRADLDRTLRLLGCPAVAQLDRSYVNVPRNWDAI